jgi:hypothetical protein
MILHWQCIPDSRNGIYMMKYALICPDEFNQPVAAFFMGFCQCVGIWLTELCNVLKSLDQKNPQDVIVRFVGLALILTVPKIIIPSMENFDVKNAVGKLTLNRKRKQFLEYQNFVITQPEQRLCCKWLFNSVYCLFKWFYASFYFYFFPFIIVFIPLIKVTYLYSVKEEAIIPVTA